MSIDIKSATSNSRHRIRVSEFDIAPQSGTERPWCEDIRVSYDLAVWEGERPASDFAALAEFKDLYQRYMAVSGTRQEPTPRIVAFVTALLAR